MLSEKEKLAFFLEIAQPVCMQDKVMSMHRFVQHGTTSCLEHCIAVAYYSFLLAEMMGISYDKSSLIRGALLHDYFLYDWHKPHGRWHGFVHPGIALRNASQDFTLTEIEKNLIVRHMFPLVPIPPKNVEGALVCFVDKWCSLRETFSGNAYENESVIKNLLHTVDRKLEEQERRNGRISIRRWDVPTNI